MGPLLERLYFFLKNQVTRSGWSLPIQKKYRQTLRPDGISLAGALGIEPRTRVLETRVIPLHHTPTTFEVYQIISTLSRSVALKQIYH